MHAPLRVERVTLFRRVIREPLVHFLLIGLLFFVAYGAAGRSGDRKVRVDDNVASALFGQFQSTWQRAPTAKEMDALVDSYIREEIFYREGVALGLDRDDPTIKRRVSQKFATIAEESEPANPPTDAELERWMKQHAARYAEPSLVSFDQIAFEPAKSPTSEMAAFRSAREALARGANPQSLGNSRMLLPHFELYPADLIERDFGADFAKGLMRVPAGRWEGPLRSGFGVHLVRVEKVIGGKLPGLDEVRTAVARDYEEDRRQRSLEAAYRKLRRSYNVEYSGKWQRALSQ